MNSHNNQSRRRLGSRIAAVLIIALSLTMFEKTPLNQLLAKSVNDDFLNDSNSQLLLFD